MNSSPSVAPNETPPQAPSIKVIGVGNAGGNAVSLMACQGLAGVTFALVNTEALALSRSGVSQQCLLGQHSLRGLTAGGDPEVGRAVALEEEEALKSLCAGVDMIFIVAGLGGGTGTGAGPVLARIAKASGALVLAVVTLPLEFEGKRRSRQAMLGLQQLRAEADSVICLPNQKIFKLVDEKTSMLEAFQVMNSLVAEGVRGIWRLLVQPPMIKLDLADLRMVSQGKHAECALATVETSGEKRAKDAVDKLLSHVLLDQGRMLAEADALLVSIVGGQDLSVGEINRIMELLNRQAEHAQVAMGACLDLTMNGRLAVTVIASRFGGSLPEVPSALPAPMGAQPVPGSGAFPAEQAAAATASAPDNSYLTLPEGTLPLARFAAPPASLTPERAEQTLQRQAASRSRRKKANALQTQLPLDITSKSRFEKSERTIVQGENLDEPTFLRRGVVLN